MTILTKPFSEKKGEKDVAPLVFNEQTAPANAPEDVESQQRRMPRILIFPAGARPHRVTTVTTLCLLLTALTVVGIGIVGGKILYDQYIRVAHKRFEGWAQIPMNDDDTDFKHIFKDYFQENFEISNDEKYEKIDVPDFRDGRSGRFIHDFNTNTTGIIDITGRRCFVMPLNRDNVLPPKSLFDLIHKMWEGYYKVNTDLVRKNMRVIIPPITDTKTIGGYIASECDGLPIYKLEKYVGGVVKRSADKQSERFAQFAGQGVTQIEITNMDEVYAYEKSLISH
ncbi:integral membrane protein 2C isoform X2 [Diabrotica virgifera virgifera]|uniref:Integral membrane protein 2 n=1 Tax=Diabrotica virgifera virgifera TaxID=50390 RepID=A0ABM5KTJ1_DIAVI|nr:integral membrane protein 2C isoform X2 [Diabrotica virgifera virgifera]